MKFKVTIGEFLKHLQKALPAIPPKSTVPVLEHLQFTVDNDNLKIVATDQDIVIQTQLTVSEVEPGSVLVPARKLFDIIKALDNQGEIEFKSDDATFEIIIEKGKGRYKMKGIDADEFLHIPELFESPKPFIETDAEGTIDVDLPSADFTKNDLIKLCDKTHFAVSIDTLRPAMMGVLFQFRETYVNAVATDSFRLSRASIYSTTPKYPQDFDVIIPIKAIELLRKVDADSTMTVIELYGKITHLKFVYGSTVFITRVINEKFPPYETVLPKNNEITALIDKKSLLTAVKRVALFSNSLSKQLKFIFDDSQLTITGEDEDSGTLGTEVINCEFNSTTFNIAFNYKYIEDAINSINDEDTEASLVKMTFSESSKPSLILANSEKNEVLILVMPVRI